MTMLATIISVISTYTIIQLVARSLDKKPQTEDILFIHVV